MKKEKEFYTPKEIFIEYGARLDENGNEVVDLRSVIENLNIAVDEQSRTPDPRRCSGQRVKGLGSIADPSDPKTLKCHCEES